MPSTDQREAERVQFAGVSDDDRVGGPARRLIFDATLTLLWFLPRAQSSGQLPVTIGCQSG